MLPSKFLERLSGIFDSSMLSNVLQAFDLPDPFTVRINTLKADAGEILAQLRTAGIDFDQLAWSPEALVVKNADKSHELICALISNGFMYQQAVSSLLPAVVLGVQRGESVLDACAAPGSKTSQMASLMRNEGNLTAVEAVKARYFKLRAVCELLGVKNTAFKLTDVRRFKSRDEIIFDRVLVDAPCSSEGRFKSFEPKTFAYWSARKIQEMSYKQKGILLSASRLLKPGGELVYSTCTFAPEENEEVVDWFLRKSQGEFHLKPVCMPGVPSYPAVKVWQGREYKAHVEDCFRVLPGGIFSGFFIARFVKAPA